MRKCKQSSTYHERIIIGAGVAATALYAELPSELRKGKFKNGWPKILVLNDSNNPDQWKKDLTNGNVVMAREAEVQTPQVFSHRPNDFEITTSHRNPYGYVLTNQFNSAQTGTQQDLGMRIHNLKALKIEYQSSNTNDWEYPTYPLRIVATDGRRIKLLYTQHIDICTGLGISRKLNDQQIPEELAKKFINQNKLIYGQDQANAKLNGKIVIYGGSARNATIISDLVLKKSPAEIIWVSRSEKDLVQTAKLSRLYSDLINKYSKNIQLCLGTLEKIEELENGKMKIFFSKPKSENNNSILPTLSNQYIECDQIVVSIGQDANPITKNLTGFIPYVYQDYEKPIPLGTISKDKRITVWGAAASIGIGLNETEKLEFNNNLTEFTSTLPSENQSNGNVYITSWMIKKMIYRLRQENLFPQNEKSPAKLDLPDINIATFKEITEVIRLASNKEISECKGFTMNIIQERAKYPLGIKSPENLPNNLPFKMKELISMKFFPFNTKTTENKKIAIDKFDRLKFNQLTKSKVSVKNMY